MKNSNQANKNLFNKHHFLTLTEFSNTIHSFRTLNDLSNFLILTLMGKFLINRCALFINFNNSLRFISSKGIEQKFEEMNFSDFKELKNLIQKKFIENDIFNHFVMLTSEDKLSGVILYSFHSKKDTLNDDEKILFESLIRISTIAIENFIFINNLNELNRKLQIKISHARSLFELSKEFSLLLSEDDVYKFLSYTIMGNFLVNKIALVKNEINSKRIIGSSFDENLKDELDKIDFNKIVNPIDLSISSENFLKSLLFDRYQISLIIPLEIKNKLIGLILCGNKLNNSHFSQDEIEFIQSIGSIAAISLENIRLFHETIEKQRIEEDIRIAQEIQRNLLPSKLPESKLFEFFGLNEPSKLVGGDYFDVFRLNDNQILILIADAVGKGISASLVMSNLQATVKALTRLNFNLAQITKELNNLMKQNLSSGNFITLFWGILDEKEKTLEYINAGHNPPILIRENEIFRLDEGGILIGVLELNQDYKSEKIELNSKDLICLFTDGFIEAIDENEKEFGEEKFIQKLIESKNLPLDIIANKLIEEVITYSNNSNSLDDLTILLTRVK